MSAPSSPVPQGSRLLTNPIDSDPVGEGPSGTVEDATDTTVSFLASEALTKDPETEAPASLEGRASVVEPKATMSMDGILTVEFEGRTYTYNTSGEPFAAGAANNIFKESVANNASDPYVLRVPKEKSSESYEVQMEALKYQRELHKDGVLPFVETPGKILTYTDPRTNETHSAILMKEYNRVDLYEVMVDSKSEFATLSGESMVTLAKQMQTGLTGVASKGSTYLSLRAENIGMECTSEGSLVPTVRDFDKTINLPEAKEDSPIFKDPAACKAFAEGLEMIGDKSYTHDLILGEEMYQFFDLAETLQAKFDHIHSLLENGERVPRRYIQDVISIMGSFQETVGKIQSFQLGVTLYEMMNTSHESPYRVDHNHIPIIRHPERWHQETRTTLQAGFVQMGLPSTHEYIDTIMGLLHPNPKERTALVSTG